MDHKCRCLAVQHRRSQVTYATYTEREWHYSSVSHHQCVRRLLPNAPSPKQRKAQLYPVVTSSRLTLLHHLPPHPPLPLHSLYRVQNPPLSRCCQGKGQLIHCGRNALLGPVISRTSGEKMGFADKMIGTQVPSGIDTPAWVGPSVDSSTPVRDSPFLPFLLCLVNGMCA